MVSLLLLHLQSAFLDASTEDESLGRETSSHTDACISVHRRRHQQHHARLLHLRSRRRHGHRSPGTNIYQNNAVARLVHPSALAHNGCLCLLVKALHNCHVRPAQGGSFLALERHRGAAGAAEAPEKKEVREIEFFPAASANHTGGGRISVPDESELAAPFSSPYAGRAAPQLDLSLRL